LPLQLVTAPDTHALWQRCLDAFLDDLEAGAPARGRAAHAAHLWLTQRAQRDLLLEAARARGIAGWLAPPFSFFSELRDRFAVAGRPVGPLMRRRLIATVAARHAAPLRIAVGREDRAGVVRGHMLDSLFGELLPEGVTPERLAEALARVESDEFAGRRNRWVVESYAGYLAELERRELFDARSIHARVAQRVEGGGLREAIGDASRLHVYGLYTTRSRRRLLRTLGGQQDVDVVLYALEGARDAETLTDDVAQRPLAGLEIQPAPDAHRELAWVAGRIKRLLVEEQVSPHAIAVVARSGERDTREACDALRAAGVPCTARIRTPLAQVAALKALLELFRGAALDWSYRPLRQVLTTPYFGLEVDAAEEDPRGGQGAAQETLRAPADGEAADGGAAAGGDGAGGAPRFRRRRVDIRSFDFLSGQGRVRGLAQWQLRLEHLLAARREDDRWARGAAVHSDRLAADLRLFARFRELVEPLAAPRTERDWVAATRRLLEDDPFGMRRRLCRPAAGEYDVVRLDQRGVKTLESLLSEWADIAAENDPGEPLTPAEWHRLLRRLLQSQELSLTTPGQKGVQVLEAHDAALTPFRHVFVVHANDGEFPRLPEGGGVFTDSERAALAEHGLPLADRTRAIVRERSLWFGVTAAPHTVLSYRTTDPRGVPLLPSLLVPEHDPATELPRTWEPPEHAASPAQEARRAAAELAELRRAGRAEADARPATTQTELFSVSERPVVRTTEPDALRRAVLVAVAEHARGARGRSVPESAHAPHPWNGLIREPAVLAYLRTRYEQDYPWSASQLERYARMPFAFLLERVLRLDLLEEAQESTDRLTFGGVAHAILENFYNRVKDRAPRSLIGQTHLAFEAACDDVFAHWEAMAASGRAWLGAPVVWRHIREGIRGEVREYLLWEFGIAESDGESVWGCEIELATEAGEPVTIRGQDLRDTVRAMRLRGRIDRVDRIDKGKKAGYHILDYKSGYAPTTGGYRDGSVLQGPLYMAALEEIQDFGVAGARYRSIKQRRTKNSAWVHTGDRNHERALRIAFSIPERVRLGLFEAAVPAGQKPLGWDPPLEVRRSDLALPDETFRWDGDADGEGGR